MNKYILGLVLICQISHSKAELYPWLGESDDFSLGDDLAFRLAPGNGTYGRLEVHQAGEWGTVCKRNFDLKEAVVACRTLELARYNIYITTAKDSGLQLNTSEPILLSGFSCSGDESNLTSCEVYANTTNCTHDEDIVISCMPAPASISYPERLSGFNKNNKGVYQIFVNKQWGDVCYNGDDDGPAKVACRSLGKPVQGAKVLKNETTKANHRWMTVESCTGKEVSLFLCNADPLGFNSTCHEPLVISCQEGSAAGGDNTGLIVGLCIGCVLALLILLGFVYFIRKRRAQDQPEKSKLIEYDAKYSVKSEGGAI